MNISVPAFAAPLPRKADLLLQLAERCEREEPSRQLDLDIACGALGFESDSDFSTGRYGVRPAGRIWWSSTLSEIKAFTSSLDAAVTLVPAGAWRETNGPRRYLGIPTPSPNFWRCQVTLWEPTYGDFHGWAVTEALAICAAALRARAAGCDLSPIAGDVKREGL